MSVDSEPEGTSTQDKSSLASLRTTLFSFPPFDKPERKILQSPVDYVEDEEDDGEDDEEGDVDEGVVALLPLAASQLPKLHLHQDGSVPEHAFFQIVKKIVLRNTLVLNPRFRAHLRNYMVFLTRGAGQIYD